MDNSRNVFPSEIIRFDEKSQDSKKRSVKSYASKVFQESTIGIVASIASTHSNARRIFKSLVLLLSIVGFLYQSITFLIYVFQYPTTVDVDIQKPEHFDMPAFTFCNNNGIKRSVFCSNFSDRCVVPTDEFCSKYYSYCGKNRTLVPKKEFLNLEDSLTYEELISLSKNDFDEFLLVNKSELLEPARGPYLRPKDDKGAMLCYTLHSVVDVPEKPRQIMQNRGPFSKNEVSSKLTFYVREDEMFIPGNRAGVLFAIHSPFNSVNPFNKGINLKPGRNYRIFVTMVQEVLLKEPFSTDCVNYEEAWESNNRTGPRMQEMCQQKCILDIFAKCLTCVEADILYPHNLKICPKGYLANFDGNYTCSDLEEEVKTFYDCYNRCKDDCKVTKYTPDVMDRYEVDFEENEGLEHFNRYITVEIILEAGEVMTLRHSPKYMTVEVFSSIGGFIGCWLGISLMDIIDVLASIFTVSRYSLRKNKKQNKQLAE